MGGRGRRARANQGRAGDLSSLYLGRGQEHLTWTHFLYSGQRQDMNQGVSTYPCNCQLHVSPPLSYFNLKMWSTDCQSKNYIPKNDRKTGPTTDATTNPKNCPTNGLPNNLTTNPKTHLRSNPIWDLYHILIKYLNSVKFAPRNDPNKGRTGGGMSPPSNKYIFEEKYLNFFFFF